MLGSHDENGEGRGFIHLDVGRDEGAAWVTGSEEVGCGDEACQDAGDCCEEAEDVLDACEGGVHLGGSGRAKCGAAGRLDWGDASCGCGFDGSRLGGLG